MATHFSGQPDTTPAHVAYGIMAISVFTAFPIFIAAIIAWLNRGNTRNSLMLAHYRWLLRTFWFNLLWWIVGFVLTIVFVGYFIMLFNQLWLIYRIAFGWYYLSQRRKPWTSRW